MRMMIKNHSESSAKSHHHHHQHMSKESAEKIKNGHDLVTAATAAADTNNRSLLNVNSNKSKNFAAKLENIITSWDDMAGLSSSLTGKRSSSVHVSTSALDENNRYARDTLSKISPKSVTELKRYRVGGNGRYA